MEGVEGVEVRDVIQPGAGQFKVESAMRRGNPGSLDVPRIIKLVQHPYLVQSLGA